MEYKIIAKVENKNGYTHSIMDIIEAEDITKAKKRFKELHVTRKIEHVEEFGGEIEIKDISDQEVMYQAENLQQVKTWIIERDPDLARIVNKIDSHSKLDYELQAYGYELD